MFIFGIMGILRFCFSTLSLVGGFFLVHKEPQLPLWGKDSSDQVLDLSVSGHIRHQAPKQCGKTILNLFQQYV